MSAIERFALDFPICVTWACRVFRDIAPVLIGGFVVRLIISIRFRVVSNEVGYVVCCASGSRPTRWMCLDRCVKRNRVKRVLQMCRKEGGSKNGEIRVSFCG